MIRVVAFDLDDTLWHVDPVIVKAEERLGVWLKTHAPALKYDMRSMRDLRHELLEENPGIVGRVTEFRLRLIEKAMLKSDISASQASSLAESAMEIFLEARNDIEFFAGALDAIKQIAEDYQVGALTNGNADIDRLGLADHFSFAFSAEDVGAAKPAPDLFHAALVHTGCAPQEMVYVGDDPVNDVDTAKSVGLATIWLRNERRPGPGSTEPDHTINDIAELPEAIERLNSR